MPGQRKRGLDVAEIVWVCGCVVWVVRVWLGLGFVTSRVVLVMGEKSSNGRRERVNALTFFSGGIGACSHNHTVHMVNQSVGLLMHDRKYMQWLIELYLHQW